MEPRIGYLLKGFPRISETFILNEILELEKNGINLCIYSIINPKEARKHRLVDEVRSTVTYMPYPLFSNIFKCLKIHGEIFIRFPMNYIKTFFKLLSMRKREHFKRLSQACYLTKLLLKDKINHLHSGFVHEPGTVAWLTYHITGIPYSLASHAKDIYHSCPHLLRKKLTDAKLVFTCTQYNIEKLQQIASPRKIQRLRHVYHGVHLERFPFGTSIPHDPPIILAVARLVEKKGLQDLIHACNLLKQKNRKFECIIIGDGELREQITHLIHQLNLEENVILKGALSQEEVKEWYRKASVFALPCLITENGDRDGIPNVLVEASATGIPIITTSVSGIAELVNHEETGLQVSTRDPQGIADAIERIFDSPELRERLRIQARNFVEKKFNLQENAITVASELKLQVKNETASHLHTR